MDHAQTSKKSPTAGVRKLMTDEEWERWIEAFRKHPGETVKVAELMGCPRNRARLAWYHGWPKQGRPAITELLAADQHAARAKRAELEEVEEELPESTARDLVEQGPDMVMRQMLERDQRRQRAAADSAKTRAEEGAMIATARRNGIALAAVTAQLIRGANTLMARIGPNLAKEDISVKDAVSLVQKIAVITRLGTEASKMALTMERAAMGEPMGDEVTANGRIKPEQAAAWVALGMKAIQRFQERNGGVDEVEGRSASKAPAARSASTTRDDEDDDTDDRGLAAVGRAALPN